MSVRPETLTSAMKQIARCSACRRPPEKVTTVASPFMDDLEMRVYCHGSYESISVSMLDIELDRFDHLARDISDCFKHDNFPDMVELLKYNRNPWVVS